MKKLIVIYFILLAGIATSLATLDKPTRLATLPATSADRVNAEVDAAKLAETRRIYTYPQVIHNQQKPGDNPRKALTIAARSNGIDRKELKCLHTIVSRESHYNPKADNPHSSAYGIFQQLKLKPGTPLDKQISLGLKYIKHRYGTACKALDFHNRNGWY